MMHGARRSGSSTRRRVAWLAVPGLLLLVLLLAVWLQREALLRQGLNLVLAPLSLAVATLDGLQLGPQQLQLDALELQLLDSGQRLQVTQLTLDFRYAGLAALPTLDALRIASLRLLPAAVPATAAGSSATDSSASAALDVPAMLQLLHDFPLASIDVAAVQLPQLDEVLQARLRAAPGNFTAELDSASYSAALTLQQADATGAGTGAAAALQLQAQLGALLNGNAQFSLLPATDPQQLAGSGEFDLQGQWQQQPWQASGTLQLPACSLASRAACSLQFTLDATLDALRVGDAVAADVLHLQELRFTSSGNVSPEPLRLQLAPDTRLQVESLQAADWQAGALQLQTATPLTVQQATDAAQWQLNAAAVQGTLAAFDSGAYHMETAFTARELDLQLGSTSSGTLTLATQGLLLRGPQAWLPAFDMEAALTLQGDLLQFSTPLLTRTGTAQASLQLRGSHDLASGSGSAELQLAPLQLAAAGPTLAGWLGPWPASFDLVQGSIDAGLQLQWAALPAADGGTASTAVRGTLQAGFKDVAGYYDSSFFRGFNAALHGSFDSTRAFMFDTAPLQLTLAELDVGLPLRQLSASLQLQADGRLRIDSLDGELLGGSIAMQDQHYDFSTDDNALTLRFDGLRLDQLLALTQYQDLAVSGAVSGEVPLHVSDGRIEVADGTLVALQPGGSIHYLGDLGAGQAAANLDLVRQALSNYQFDSLQSSIDYSPAGELLLSMQLQGFNPELENGRRVNLNLNLSDNIPALLQSLQAGRAIEDLVQELYE